MSLLTYLIELTACSALLFAYYHFFLKNRQQHRFNRIFLLLSVICSIVVPVISIPVLPADSTLILSGGNQRNSIVNDPIQSGITSSVSDPFNWMSLVNPFLLAVYILVSGILLTVLVKSLIRLYKLTHKYTSNKMQGLDFYNTSEPGTPYSFFRFLFWNKDIDLQSRSGQQIFRHEFYHIRQRHSMDVLFIEILNAFFWMNPIFFVIKSELKAIHEFMADEFAASQSDPLEYAELLVFSTIQNQTQSAATPFASFHIKRRIAMITKTNSQTRSAVSQFFALPLFLTVFSAFGLAKKEHNAIVKPSAENIPKASIIQTQKSSPAWHDSKNFADNFPFSTIDRKVKQPLAVSTDVKGNFQDSLKKKKQPKDDDWEKTFTKTEIESTYPGGFEAWKRFLRLNQQYPELAVQKKIEGTVIVQFVVDKEGYLSDINAISGPDELKAEAVRLIEKSSRWTPAVTSGKKVRAYKKQPIVFRLDQKIAMLWQIDPAEKAHDNIYNKYAPI